MSEKIEVGLTITTADDSIRKAFEPRAPSIPSRLRAIEALHENGIKTYVMIAPILPEAENLPRILSGKVDYIIIDRMNGHDADRIYKKHGWNEKNTDEYFNLIGRKMENECAELGIECRRAF